MRYVDFWIDPKEYIFENGNLTEEEKENLNQCVITDIEKEQDDIVRVRCVLFHNDDGTDD